MVADFQSEYGIELETWGGKGSAFRARLTGLLQTESRLWRHFIKTDDETEADDDV